MAETKNKAENVSAAKPKVTGSIYTAELGTTLPTDAVSELDTKFVSCGYVGQDGVTNSTSIESSNTSAWGGDVVDASENGRTDTFKFKLIECMNTDVLGLVHGTDNVTGTLATGVTIEANASEQVERVFVIDTILKGGVLKRIVIPRGKITAIGDVVYNGKDVVGYELTVTAFKDGKGTHKEFLKKGTS